MYYEQIVQQIVRRNIQNTTEIRKHLRVYFSYRVLIFYNETIELITFLSISARCTREKQENFPVLAFGSKVKPYNFYDYHMIDKLFLKQ